MTLAVTLSVGGEPDVPVDGDGTNSNRTVDLGFVPGPTAIGLGDVAVSGRNLTWLAVSFVLLVGVTLATLAYSRRTAARS